MGMGMWLGLTPRFVGERLRPPLGTEEEEEEEGWLLAPLPRGPFWGIRGSLPPVPCRALPPLLRAGPCSPGGMEERRG